MDMDDTDHGVLAPDGDRFSGGVGDLAFHRIRREVLGRHSGTGAGLEFVRRISERRGVRCRVGGGAKRFLRRELGAFPVADGCDSIHPDLDAGIAVEGMRGLAVQRLQPPEPLVQGEIREPRRSAGRVQPFVTQQVIHPAEHEVKLAFLMRQTGRDLLHGRRRVSPHLGAVPEEGFPTGRRGSSR